MIDAAHLVPNGLDRGTPAQANFLDTLSQGHPRLFATLERFTWLQQQVANNPGGQPARWYASLYNSATNLLTNLTTVTYAPDVRGTILDESRTVIDRMYKLGIAYRITGNTNFAKRAWLELQAAGNFPDWHPPHFLDTAEMTHAFAVGYDWFYDYWNPAQRTFLLTNIVSKGLDAGLTEFNNNVGWSRSTGNNWNFVCNGGLTLGALAIGADDEAKAARILTKATASVRPVLSHFNTDNGAWYEGPGYWDYSTDYLYRHFTGLESALGSDFGLSKTDNFNQTGLFSMLLGSAAKRIFNFADTGGAGVPTGAQFFYLARRYLRPDYAWFQRTNGGADALGALWFDARGGDPAGEGLGHDF